MGDVAPLQIPLFRDEGSLGVTVVLRRRGQRHEKEVDKRIQVGELGQGCRELDKTGRSI